ncbi:MAG: biopolymer transporter ExbD [Candidatus Aureabacteria bacterium]|nr:biopolymer transporter ExbD [Candidatus Auribacterota bacterium]MCK5162027.1 biopolymer transporter ExbD [Candidatus Auribacterota bacterium]
MEFGKRKKRKILVNITSLIDVMFLLLIFFAVTSTFLEHPGITIELPAAGSSEVVEKKEIMITVTRDEKIHLNGEEIKKNQFEKKLGSLVKNYKDPTVILRADKDVTYGLIIELMDSIKRLGLKKVVAFTKIDLTKPPSPSEKLKL